MKPDRILMVGFDQRGVHIDLEKLPKLAPPTFTENISQPDKTDKNPTQRNEVKIKELQAGNEEKQASSSTRRRKRRPFWNEGNKCKV